MGPGNSVVPKPLLRPLGVLSKFVRRTPLQRLLASRVQPLHRYDPPGCDDQESDEEPESFTSRHAWRMGTNSSFGSVLTAEGMRILEDGGAGGEAGEGWPGAVDEIPPAEAPGGPGLAWEAGPEGQDGLPGVPGMPGIATEAWQVAQ